MSAIPLHDLDHVATKGDLQLMASELRGEMAELRAELRGEMAELRADLIGEIGALRRSMTTWMLTLMVAIIGAMASIGFTI